MSTTHHTAIAASAAANASIVNAPLGQLDEAIQPMYETQAAGGGTLPSNPIVGKWFFYTVEGKPVWYTGSAWVDWTGTAI